MDEGVAQILPKPFDIDDLLRAVEVALQERAF
jgi:DNA-binding NtrC family response regulator